MFPKYSNCQEEMVNIETTHKNEFMFLVQLQVEQSSIEVQMNEETACGLCFRSKVDKAGEASPLKSFELRRGSEGQLIIETTTVAFKLIASKISNEYAIESEGFEYCEGASEIFTSEITNASSTSSETDSPKNKNSCGLWMQSESSMTMRSTKRVCCLSAMHHYSLEKGDVRHQHFRSSSEQLFDSNISLHAANSFQRDVSSQTDEGKSFS